jgi:hypothetical protein
MSQEYILERSLSPSEAAARLDITVEELEARRENGTLLGVWMRTSHTWAYPAFQFALSVSPYGLERLLSILASRVGFSPITDDRGGWARASWLFQPNEQLSFQSRAARGYRDTDPVAFALTISNLSSVARTPADAFADDPVSVIEMAQSLYAGLATLSRQEEN